MGGQDRVASQPVGGRATEVRDACMASATPDLRLPPQNSPSGEGRLCGDDRVVRLHHFGVETR